MNTYYELTEFMETLQIVSTHSHYLPDAEFENGYGLPFLLNNSYCRAEWCGVKMRAGEFLESDYFDVLRHRNFFIWLEKSLQKIYNLQVPLSRETFGLYDQTMKEYSKEPGHHFKILNQYSKYDRIILDANWDPGTNNGHPELFSSSFRIDSFLVGPGAEEKTYDGHNCRELYGIGYEDFDIFFLRLRNLVEEKIRSGAVALKCAIAYERGLDFEPVSEQRARIAFEKGKRESEMHEKKIFQDYVFSYICQLAAELDIPVQVHTGLARLYRTNALQLRTMIMSYPDTRFVLFHGSYPWMEDVLGLAESSLGNVYPDLAWLPLISTEAAIRFLSELLEVANPHTICWGDDTWTSEESFGALLAARHTLATVLADKVRKGYYTMADAREIAEQILSRNARQIYKL